MNSQNLLEIKNLFVEYKTSSAMNEGKNIFAVNDLSLDIKKGEIFAIAGESGCGKSTLAKAILRLVDVKSGKIWLREEERGKRKEREAKSKRQKANGDIICHCEEGQSPDAAIQDSLSAIQPIDILKLNKKELKTFRQSAQMIFQNPYSSLNPKMKIYEILKEPLIIHKKSLTKSQMNEIITNTIKQVGLDERALTLYPHEFSGGQRQRIAIARALILNPAFILADEPVSALDVSIQGQIINLLNELKEKFNLTFLFISHDLNVIKYLSDRVGIMYLGEIVEIGTSEEIFSSPKHPYTEALLSANPGNKKEKIILKGDLPSPSDLPSGCKFHTRCPKAMDICREKSPTKTDFSETHCAYCHLYISE